MEYKLRFFHLNVKFNYMIDFQDEPKKKWNNIEKLLIQSMQAAANECFQNGKLTHIQRDSYFISSKCTNAILIWHILTLIYKTKEYEEEITKGILEIDDANEKTAVIIRIIEDLHKQDSEKCGQYLDDNEESKFLLDDLKKRLQEKLSNENIIYQRVCERF